MAALRETGYGGVVGWRRRHCGRLETAAWVAGDGGAAGDWRRRRCGRLETRRLGLDRAQGLVRPNSGPARPTGSGSAKGQRWSFWNVSLSPLMFFFIIMEAVSTDKHSRFHNGTRQKQALAVCCSQFVVFAMSHSKNSQRTSV
jgi:hypothetical protein